MIRYEDALRQAFSEYMHERLCSNIYREDKFVTSKSFDKKMSKMLKSEHSLYHKATLTRARKILCVAAVILALLLSSLSVGAVRDLIANFFVRQYSDHNTMSANTEETGYPDKLEEVYELGYVPDGYKLQDEIITKKDATYLYFNDKNAIAFTQSTKDYFDVNVDNEHSRHVTETYNGQEYYFVYSDEGEIEIIWDNGRYVFLLFANLPKETMLDLCNSLKIR